ncbi:putative sepiapterin reductase-like [Apostichopus japonicus]|uniref:Putative sepiapterin reductase-like n=1 Tax=Stichopus japonicus TaxID=307972 RepID=A0A2G8JTY4_STIJA|nr:putative sepiapterin reductase-like [Apostichopus japonicus]
MANLNVPTVCIVTGASKGIGREVAIQLAQKADPKSSFYLIARNKQALEETAQKIRAAVGVDVDIRCISADLSTDEGVEKSNRDIFENLGDVSRFSHAILVNNAASVGDMTKYARELDDMNFLQGFCRLNLSGPIVLTSKFFKAFGHGKDSLRKTIVQVSSDNGTIPYKTMHTYCMVKAGRDMFFRVMALEEPEVRIISYDPGAVDTDMYRETFTSADREVESTVKMIAKQTYFLKPEQSAGALVQALEEDKYENASIVRAYDVLGMEVDY